MKNRHLLDATRASVNGLRLLVRERAFRRELVLVVIAVGVVIGREGSTLSLMLVAVSLVILAFEGVNTAIERLCDFVHPHFDQSIGHIKDLASTAVLFLLFVYVLFLTLAIVK